MSGAIEDTPGLIASPAADPDGLAALDRARAYLLSLQQPAGWWKGELETNVTMDAEDMLLREFLGIREAGKTARARPRGSAPSSARTAPGATSPAAPATSRRRSSPTSRCELAGDDPRSRHMRRAAEWVRANGGLRAGAGVHPHLDGAVRRLGLGPGAGAAAGDDPAAAVVPAQRLRLRLLGAPDGRRAVGRARATPGPPAAVLDRRAARPGAVGSRRKATTPIGHAVRRARPRPAGSTSVTRSSRCAGSACAGPSGGSSTARSPTAAGAGSSRPGSTR